jgi:hypothetical protein
VIQVRPPTEPSLEMDTTEHEATAPPATPPTILVTAQSNNPFLKRMEENANLVRENKPGALTSVDGTPTPTETNPFRKSSMETHEDQDHEMIS